MSKNKINRVLLIVLDSVGVGSLPDAAAYGDEGANTLGHIAAGCGGLKLPNLEKLGLGNIIPVQGVAAAAAPLASWGRMAEMAHGKDTIAGHWEMMGIVLEQAFALFPHGFPVDLLVEFKSRTGVAGILGNKAASGTEIIAELGDEHVRSGFPIVYTSADSVLQIAAHEEIIPLPELYEMCLQARKLCDSWRIGWVFANLVDFDMLYGHRNDIAGYGAALETFDRELGALLPRLAAGDILIITADHGCDPAFPGPDHTREFVPLLVYGPGLPARALGDRRTFADIGASILDVFALAQRLPGQNFMAEIFSGGT